jgi:hypothetical protein
MKNLFLLFVALTMLFAFSGCFNQRPDETTKDETPTTTEPKEKTVVEFPKTQEDCLANGGIWKKVGIYPNPICNIPTKDGGKECASSNDCEGSCLAVLTDDQRRSLMKGENSGIEVPGKCTSMLRNFGCIGFVEGGKVDRFLCLD